MREKQPSLCDSNEKIVFFFLQWNTGLIDIFFSERFPFLFFDASNHSGFFLNIGDEFL